MPKEVPTFNIHIDVSTTHMNLIKQIIAVRLVLIPGKSRFMHLSFSNLRTKGNSWSIANRLNRFHSPPQYVHCWSSQGGLSVLVLIFAFMGYALLCLLLIYLYPQELSGRGHLCAYPPPPKTFQLSESETRICMLLTHR